MLELTPTSGAAHTPAAPRGPSSLRVLLVYRHYASSFVYYPWMLARAGLVVDVVTTRNHPIWRSKHVRRVHAVASTDDAFREAIAGRLAAGNYALLLLMDEPSRTLVYRGALDPVIERHLPVPRESDLVEAFSDKERFQAWCERHGIPTPQTCGVETESEAVACARAWNYPIVLKGVAGMGGKAVRICRSASELSAAFGELSASGGRVLAQRFIAGAIGSTSFVALQGEMSAWTASEKFISVAKGLGPSAVRRIRTDPVLGELAAKIAAEGKITGITGFDWMEAGPGEFLVIDPHFGRCTPPAAISHLAGVDVGAAVRDLLEGTGRKQAPRGSGKIVVMFPQMLELALQGGLWKLVTRANPLSSRVHYDFGPRSEWALSLRLGTSYLSNGARVLLGRVRQIFAARPGPVATKVSAAKPHPVSLA